MTEACDGVPPAEQPDGRVLLSDEGRSLGFCRAIARRDERPTLGFGPGDFARRIA